MPRRGNGRCDGCAVNRGCAGEVDHIVEPDGCRTCHSSRRVDQQGVCSCGRERLRFNEDAAAAIVRVGELRSVGFVDTEIPTAAKGRTAVDADALPDRAAKSKACDLTGRVHLRRYGRAADGDRAHQVNHVVEADRRRARHRPGGIDDQRVRAGDGQRLRFDKNAAAAVERVDELNAVRLVDAEIPAAAEIGSAVDAQALSRRAAESQTGVLPRRRDAHGSGGSSDRDRAARINHVVEIDRCLPGGRPGRVYKNRISSGDGQRLRLDEDAAAAVDGVNQLTAIGLVNSHVPTAAEGRGSIDAHALPGEAVEREARVLPGRSGRHRCGRSAYSDDSGNVCRNVVHGERDAADV